MQNTMPQQARDSIRNHSGQKRWRYVVTVMACIVVFCTTYALILPALTMTTDTYCGKEAHTHTQECYERVLVCGQEETEAVAGHTHTDECYETESVLVCGQEERPAHTHTAECYTSESTLTCGLEEGDEHTHDENCYTQTDTLTCGLEETEGHTHSESCYQEEKHLVCGQEETPEVAGHTHTDACYEERLVCQLEEHQHTLACYSNPEADVETADVWERTLPQDLGDNWAQNVVAVAQSQLGYTESAANYTVMDDGTTMKGYTRYGAWFGDAYGDWCAMFASFCLHYAGVPQTTVPYASGCVDWVEQLQGADLYKQAADCTPQPGYLVFFDNDGDGLADHVGVVTELDEDAQTIKTVEGNSGNAVAARSYALGDGAILGYCVLPENPDEQKEEPAEKDESADTDATDKTAEGEKSADKEADIALVDDTAQVASVDDTVESIAVDETKTLTVSAGQTVKLSFVPEYTHEYVFYSSASGDTYGYLYDASGKQLTYNDDSGEGSNFKITYKLTGGETYYWGTRWYSSSRTGDIPVNLEYGTHSYVADEAGNLVCVCGAVPPLSGTCGDDLTWSFDKATGTLSITGTGAMWDYASYNKAPWALYASQIKNVTISEGATSVGSYAFNNCTALESVEFPASLATIGSVAFNGCSSLTDADLSGTALTSIADSAFYNCTALESVAFPDALASIGSTAFRGCAALESVAFPDALASIGSMAFNGCSSLTDADLSGTALTSIANSAFGNCSSLQSVEFPASLVTIGDSAFYGCSSLASADLSGTALASIGGSAFRGCTVLQSVEFPSSLASIGTCAFYGCKSLTDVDLSGTALASIGNSAFYNCPSLQSVEFPDALVTIGDSAFCNASLQSVEFPDGLTTIGRSAFYGCSSLESVTFPAALETIGDQAFFDCKSLTDVDLSGTALTSIVDNTFRGCTALGSVEFPASLATIGDRAFYDCTSLRSIDFSNTQVVSIGAYTFSSCRALGEVLLPSTLETLGERAFSSCTSLAAVAIPKSTTSVGRNALYNCNALKELRLEASNVTFDATQNALDGFHVTVANTVDTLSAATMATLNTMGCTSITFEGPHYLTVESWQGDFLPEVLVGRSAGEYYVDEQGVLYRIDSETNTASVFYCPAGIEAYTVPKELPAKSEGGQSISVTGVDGFAFADAADLTSITFEAPEAITTLADRAFSRATNLESINGKTTSAEVLATFTSDGLKYGSMLFSQTKITDDGVSPSTGSMEVKKDDLTLTVSTEPGTRRNPAQSDDGTYCYYTGEDAQTTIAVSSGSEVAKDGTVVRVYFQFDSSKGTLSYPPGTYKVVSDSTKNEYEMTVVKTDSPNCYYAEFERPEQGDTISFILTSSYPSPTSGGGDAMLWCGILTVDEKEALGSGLLPIEAYQSLDWTTKVDTFPVTKTERTRDSSKLVGDGQGGAYISGLSYNVKMSRSGDTLEGVGKDYMSSVDFTDVLTLPAGVTLAEDVQQAIANGTVTVEATYSDGYRFKTADGRVFLTITPDNSSTYYTYLRNGSVSLNDDGNLVVNWSFRNAKLDTEISSMTFNYKVADKTLIVAEPTAGVTYTMDNAVQATEHFMYSADQYQADECSVTVKTANGSLTMTKYGVAPSGSYYGSSRPWQITAQNPGALPYDKLAYITDDLPVQLYMRPADLASIFADDTEHQLTVTINNATFCTVENDRTITGVDGSSGTADPQNSGGGTTHSGTSSTDPDYSDTGTITVSWGTDGNLQIAAGDSVISCAAEEGAIESALQSLGFVVTSGTQYCLSWDLRNADGSVAPLAGGAKIEKYVYSAYKDTFMLLGSDTYHQHPTSSIRVDNYAVGRDENEAQLASGYDYFNPSREFYLSKNWSMDGKAIEEDTVIRQGDILDYSLAVSHSGNAQYDALPLVDHMTGVQALLAPVDKNSGADWASGLQTVIDNGTEYYILNQPGTYKNVWVSDSYLADTVEVTSSDSGLDTLITWYFVDYTGSRADTVSYRAYVCPSDDALTYSLNNECWLNDRASHRLYDTLPGWRGTSLGFDKVIVDNIGDTGEGYRNSNVSEGQTVVYRLSLTGSTDKDGNPQTMTITGKDMYDALPLSVDGYRWSRDNIKVTYAEGDSCTVTNGDSWSVDDPETDSNQQYLKWSDDFSLTFAGTAYIYVELTFPSGDAWQNYAVAYGTSTLTNTFYVLGGQRSVTHQLTVSAQVYLQKGVYDTGYIYNSYSTDRGGTYRSDLSIQDDRLYYQNNDSKLRAVEYYVALYNGGLTNLYLTDMQDLLPRGFTLHSASGWTSTSTGTSYVTVKKEDGSYASMKYAKVATSTSTGDDGRQLVTFSFSGTTSTYLPISYDKEKGMCYLKPGEAITFSYICRTNEAADTDDAALNTVTMPYYDFNGGGVVVDETCTVTAPNSSTYTPNDGGCDVLDNGQVEDLGFNGQTSDTQWLASDVTLVRGNIKPGITKALTSKTNESGTTTFNPTSALPRDTLTWTVTTENDGTNSIVDYVLTDQMESPYMFTGKVSYNIYDDSRGSNLIAASNSSDYLFTIASGSDSDHLLITPNSSSTATELTIGGDPVTVKCSWKYSLRGTYSYPSKTVDVQLTISRDADGNAVMSLRFPDATMAIPEGGLSKLTLSTNNTTGSLQNKQFINTCFVTPLSQIWDNTTNRGNVTTLDTPYAEGDLSTVRNSAPVTTSYGYTTSSLKSVTEVDNTTNTAKCTDDTNYIVLSDKTKLFRYTVEVGNTTPKAMDKLILIDGLPEVGDHTAFSTTDPRFSEFKVGLADAPEFVVTVTDESGGVTTLDPSAYTIEYSTKTDFDSGDWNGTSTWSSDATGARSIRLKVIDSEGTLIPAGSTIRLNFTCKIDGDVEPGQVAWNSFGYHYKLKDNTAELEAAPLKVGVKIPAVPELLKKVVDHSGQARTVDKDTEFNFLVYQGAALSGTYATREELIEALGETPYDEFTVTVKAGQSVSDSVRMSTTKWAWTEGQKYTVVELPCGEDYAFKRFVGSAASTYTLTYAQAQTQVVTCENTALRWSIDLTKENTSHEALAGAVFALYSPDAADQLDAVPEGYADLNIGLTVEHTGKTWYLKDVSTTPDTGKLTWSDLLQAQYYLLEVKAPNGYNLGSSAGQVIQQNKETQGVYSTTVVNRSGFSLPETGGVGTHPYTLGGLLLLIGAASLLLYRSVRRRRGDTASA